jgi:hypothetical protein
MKNLPPSCRHVHTLEDSQTVPKLTMTICRSSALVCALRLKSKGRGPSPMNACTLSTCSWLTGFSMGLSH